MIFFVVLICIVFCSGGAIKPEPKQRINHSAEPQVFPLHHPTNISPYPTASVPQYAPPPPGPSYLPSNASQCLSPSAPCHPPMNMPSDVSPVPPLHPQANAPLHASTEPPSYEAAVALKHAQQYVPSDGPPDESKTGTAS